MIGAVVAGGADSGALVALVVLVVIAVVILVANVIRLARRQRNVAPTVLELELRRQLRKHDTIRRMRAIARAQRRR